MDIHIRTQIEFEKIIQEEWDHPILCTRSRMCVQQLLDTQDSKTLLKKHLTEYIELMNKTFDYMTIKQTVPLLTQPTFDWSIDDQLIHSSCWRLEKIMPMLALTRIVVKEGLNMVEQESYKEASKIFEQLKSYHDSIQKELVNWKWKTHVLNHDELQLDWHISRSHYLSGLRNICMLCVGIQKQVNPAALFKLTERIIQNFVLSVAKWHNSEAGYYLPIVDCLRHKFSSDILWTEEKYGESIYRLQTWCFNPNHKSGPFHAMKSELEKTQFLLKERINTNDGAYFETIKMDTPLKTPIDFLVE